MFPTAFRCFFRAFRVSFLSARTDSRTATLFFPFHFADKALEILAKRSREREERGWRREWGGNKRRLENKRKGGGRKNTTLKINHSASCRSEGEAFPASLARLTLNGSFSRRRHRKASMPVGIKTGRKEGKGPSCIVGALFAERGSSIGSDTCRSCPSTLSLGPDRKKNFYGAPMYNTRHETFLPSPSQSPNAFN